MRQARPFVALALWFWVAAVIQQAVAPQVKIAGAEPDLLLVVALVSAVFYPPRIAAVLGFVAGVLHGGIAGADLAHYAVSGTLVAFAVGYLSGLELDVKPWYVGLTVLGGTLAAQLLMMIQAPPPETVPYVRATILSAMYNGVLAIPIYALIRRSLSPKVN
ncbi:MAG: rod shape-determining protein MreD [Armatimonadetes bacterium]|nr:rod shape-determining protein MreD [Armatimonadota bacterium]